MFTLRPALLKCKPESSCMALHGDNEQREAVATYRFRAPRPKAKSWRPFADRVALVETMSSRKSYKPYLNFDLIAPLIENSHILFLI